MDVYEIYCDLKPGVRDLDFVECVHRYLDHMRTHSGLANYRILRCKLGFRPAHLTEFQIMLEFADASAMDATFNQVAERTDPIERLHFEVNSKVQNISFALYRDFPDSVRLTGGELF